MFGFLKEKFKSVFSPTPSPFQKGLLIAIEDASQNLRTILNDNSLKLVLINSTSDTVIKDWKKQWQKGRFCDWEKDFKRSKKTPFLGEKYYMAIYSDRTLCGITRYSFDRQRAINIEVIEGASQHNPLKGFIIAAFSQVALSFSNTFDIDSVYVFEPKKETIPSYTRIGFQEPTSDGHRQAGNLVFPRTKGENLKWNTAFEYQRKKSLGQQVS
ncbi:MAG: hypothetical protein MRY79_08820 [Alphaproteobacteria bacterium]|nr:hypothetical protein [Alphaproteobacteria bacterium]